MISLRPTEILKTVYQAHDDGPASSIKVIRVLEPLETRSRNWGGVFANWCIRMATMKSASSKATVSHFFPRPNHLFKLLVSLVEPTFEALSNLYLFQNLDTVRFRLVRQGPGPRRSRKWRAERPTTEDLESMVIKPPHCHQIFIINSLADVVNIPIKHIYYTFITCVYTRGTAILFAFKTRFMPFLPGLQTLSIDFSSLGPNSFSWTDESHVSSGRA